MPADWECYLEKARESLRSAQSASTRDPKMSNCAANRAYYAAYLAELAALQKLDPLKLPQEGWQHPTVVKAFNHRLVKMKKIFTSSMIESVSYLESLRIKADYKPDHVSEAEAKDCYNKARTIVQTIEKRLREK